MEAGVVNQMELTVQGNKILRIKEKKEQMPENVCSGDYVIFQSDVQDSEYEALLAKQGCRFLDRILYFEIPLKKITTEKQTFTVPEVSLLCDRVFDDKLFTLACQAYTFDRRFHLEPVFDQEKANSVIAAYLEYYKHRDCRIYKAICKDELLGAGVVCEDADKKGIFFENVLGATKPGIKGMMTAVPLYSHMLDKEREAGFKKYAGKVSSSNQSSINLHFQLGGHVAGIYDEFILKI